MIRTQIQLTPEQYRQVKRIAGEEGISLAEVIRRFVDDSIGKSGSGRAALYDRAARLVGAFHARDRDLSTEHDRHLEGAYE